MAILSRIIASAVQLAKTISIKYLFVDQIAIDQSLDGDALIKKVLAFSALYKTITVIAAYDMVDEAFEKTVYRPHSNQGAKRLPNRVIGLLSMVGVDLWQYEVVRQLYLNWAGTFSETITRVLCKDIGMESVCDFKFILPLYALVLFLAVQGAEQVILKALGLTDPEFIREYVLQEEERRSCLRLPPMDTVPVPTVKIASVTL
ncbi:hypothetical protein BDV40DRAFT_292397 [Aspergillus tamarii]|uniref:Uncharacterized protein n=1 Tax=Aspergillus tamarii TaxID=41984 RepID=A0A5N6UGM5_ASPTM|nr:hypothetical protein BDV40DRAFT_292397 [Aspergillus tamarii]